MNKSKERKNEQSGSTYLKGITHGLCLAVIGLFVVVFNVDIHQVLSLVQGVLDYYLSVLYEGVWAYFSPHADYYLGVAVGFCPTVVAMLALITVKKMAVYSEPEFMEQRQMIYV